MTKSDGDVCITVCVRNAATRLGCNVTAPRPLFFSVFFVSDTSWQGVLATHPAILIFLGFLSSPRPFFLVPFFSRFRPPFEMSERLCQLSPSIVDGNFIVGRDPGGLRRTTGVRVQHLLSPPHRTLGSLRGCCC